MKKGQLKEIKNWVERFIKDYLDRAPDSSVRENLELKAEHTFKVEENIIRLTESLNLEEHEKDLARAIALFHDLGRFPQFLQYQTFRDSDSLNHGLLSIKIIEESGILDDIPEDEKQIIKDSIKFHNALSLPGFNEGMLFLKLLRDADKLDIWRVFSEYYSLPSEKRQPGPVHGLPDTEGLSEEILRAIKERRIGLLKDVHNQNDFRLLQLSWVFDLNFRESFKILKEQDYFSIIGEIKDPREALREVIREVKEYVERRLNSKVYFIGAGPGDPELLTVKGKKILDTAEVVIYAGSLINPEIVKGLKAELYDSSGMTLEEIIDIIKRAYHEARLVVRLHSGDTSLYSAIHEQIERLKTLNIEFEIVPGVSSFQAGSAVLAQELTIPGVSQTVVLTRLEGRTPVPEKEKLSELARHNCTIVIFLSVDMIERVQEELLQSLSPNTPFVVIEKVTWPEERIIKGRLEELARAVRTAGIKKTALIYIGNVFDTGRAEIRSRLYHKDFNHGYRN